MKTTIELPEGLLADAKAAAAKRRTTLKAVIEHALRRELYFEGKGGAGGSYEIDSAGMPVFGGEQGAEVVTSEAVHELMEELGV